MKRVVLLISSIICFFGLSARNPYLCVDIVDSYNRELVMGAQVDLLRPDSTLVQTYIADMDINYANRKANLMIDSIPRNGGFLYVTHEGYYPLYVPLPRLGPRESYSMIKPIRLTRVPFFKPKELDEVTVTASRVKMIVKGDTITYNADAFSLAQGSMLDGLIDQLPGAELKSDGRIFINGEFVQDLLVNGDNFFKGDPKIALENLPAYMVKDIKVFHRNDFNEDKPLKDLPLVMDVRLKKQFQAGWIANAEAGYGTSDRYLGRLFVMLFTRDSRLALVGNINNTNDDRKPGQTDNWNPNWQSAGCAETMTGGIDYTWNSRLREWKVEANLMASEKKSLIESTSNSERYLDGGNLYGYSTNSTDSRQFRISSDNRVQLTLPRLRLHFIPKFSYKRVKTNEKESSSTETAQSLLNSLDETGLVYNKDWNVSALFGGSWQLPMRPERIDFSASTNWTKSNRESSRLRELFFPEESGQRKLAAPEEFMPERKLTASANVSYATPSWHNRFIDANLRMEYAFNHSRIHSTRDYYLRQIGDEQLPSITDAVQNAGFVPSNSYDYVSTDDDHMLRLKLGGFFPHLYKHRYQPNMAISADIHYVPGQISYDQDNQHYAINRNAIYIDPELWFDVEDIGYLSYTYRTALPSLRNMLEVTDAANPLYIFLGNPDLKNTHTHKLLLHLYQIFPKGPELEATFNKYENMVAQSANYNLTTGVTTYKPVNVNGNWDVSAKLESPYRWRRLDKWRPDMNVHMKYQNSVDLIGLDLSNVHTFTLGGKAKLTYKIMDGLEIIANGGAEWRKMTSPMAGFDPISAVDFDYGIIFRAVKLPWNMSFTTDLMMHSRRGYTDLRLNTNDLVWNARLAKSILQGNLTFAIDGFDILGQLSNVSLTMNSQGRTEARYNTLPRYVMLHVIYRLNIQPKKK